jgi:hypothetical protein
MNLKFLPAFLLLLLFPAVGAGQSRKVTRPVSNYPADVQVGEAELEVRRSQLVHRVAVAPNGVVAVEFPADDAVVSEHPGNRDLVTLDGADEAETPATRRRATDPLIFRPGPGFTVAKSGKPLTASGVHFGSGLHVAFLSYPVADLSRNARRLILKYDLAEIAAARGRRTAHQSRRRSQAAHRRGGGTPAARGSRRGGRKAKNHSRRRKRRSGLTDRRGEARTRCREEN